MSKENLKRFMLTALGILGYVLLLPLLCRLRRLCGRQEVRILTYHSVGEDRPHETNVRTADFDLQMAFLAQHSAVINMRDIAREAMTDTHRRPVVAITFDDGYADNLHVAAPIVNRHGLTATCFLTADYIGTDNRLPHDEDFPGGCARLLSWDEVQQLTAEGFTIGSHGLSHCRFSECSDTVLAQQISGSKRLIEQRMGQPIELMSFPYGRIGDYDQRTLEQTSSAGYLAAATARYGHNVPGCGMFELKRIGMESSDNLFTLRAKLNGALDVLALLEYPAARRMVRIVNRILGA